MAEMKRLWATLTPSERKEHRYGGPGAIGADEKKEVPSSRFGMVMSAPSVSFGRIEEEGDEDD